VVFRGRAPGHGVGANPPEAESLLALKDGENVALLNDFSIVFKFKMSNTVRTDAFPLGKPDFGALIMSLDIMISQKPVVTHHLIPSNDRQHSL